MNRRTKKVKNKWKTLFYSLLILNLMIAITITTLIFWPIPRLDVEPVDHINRSESSEFIVRTTKKNLNELINAYIEKFQQGTKHKYHISLEEDVHLVGELPVFSSTVPLSIHLEPLVQENGDIILKQKSISIGLLELPNKTIMEYIRKHLPMPEWVRVIPSDEEIYVAISEMDIKSNFKVSVESFDLDANHLAFKINVPYKTLGIEVPE
jgi:uncharacterized protein YpmS